MPDQDAPAAGVVKSARGGVRSIEPLPLRGLVIGAAAAGSAGAIVGLVIGLVVHPATAWFALFEVGIPASVLGALVGAVVGVIAGVLRRSDGPPRGASRG